MHVDNARLRVLIGEYQAALRLGDARPSEELGAMLLLLCQRLSERSNFAGYSFRADMVSAACLVCLRAAAKFDPSKGTSAFSFFTTTAWRAMVDEIRRQHRRGFTPRAIHPPELISMSSRDLVRLMDRPASFRELVRHEA